jgi:hypothetical protein
MHHRGPKEPAPANGEYKSALEQIGTQIESVQDFWRYNNNTPIEKMKMRESIYLFKQGFQPIWEDRRNINGGSWTFRVPKHLGPDFWTRVQLMAIGEKLQSGLDTGIFPWDDSGIEGFRAGMYTNVCDTGDQLCGVGLSVRFNAHLISIWHRDASKQKSIDALLQTVLEELPDELKPDKAESYFYKKHSDHASFKAPGANMPGRSGTAA